MLTARSNLIGKKGKKAKKSVSALIVASGAAGTIGFTPFYNVLAGLKRPSKSDSAIILNTNGSQPGKFNSRRTQSLSVLNRPNDILATTLSATQPSGITVSSLGAPSGANGIMAVPDGAKSLPPLPGKGHAELTRAPCTEFEIEVDWGDVGNDEGDGKTATRTNAGTSPGHAIYGSSRLPKTGFRVGEQRRIQSAPATAPKLTGTIAGPETDEWLLEDEDDYVVASVKQKATKRKELRYETGHHHANYESWDDDFCEDMMDLTVPPAVESVQKGIKSDISNMRRFALHMEDLKLIYLDTQDIAASIPNNVVSPLASKYAQYIRRVEVLIDLADFVDGQAASGPNENNLRILYEIIDSSLSQSDRHDQERQMTLQELKDMVAEGKVQFGIDLVPFLIKGIGPLKQHIGSYLRELRGIVVKQR
ncbi:uncharacterized protein BJ171DRAFT_608956 [Polychytrium aggregatum]|uniref:uncharacterized protein n=1 Tax=Polychytrium aggregatum TaxID=110093 RepID=UPI0022FDFF8D|nr:uncharacterized protein BJ171DRAFT_608956 [Polychytrium aggregatum]KAI9209688.1 hypothetical protein BJ171DRAFT_608956 [Polychytrium aggregatum]